MAAYTMLGPKWDDGHITWSFALQTFSKDAAHPFSRPIDAEVLLIIEQAFSQWATVSGLTFEKVVDTADPTQAADIRIGWGSFGRSATTIGETFLSYRDATILPNVIVRLEDPEERPLTLNTSGELIYDGTSSSLYALALHEIGHALGLGHASDLSSVMYATIWFGNGGIGKSDIDGIRMLYASVAPPIFSIFITAKNYYEYFFGAPYSGPVAYLRREYIGTNWKDIIVGTEIADFINGGAGEDAINGGTGDDVLDGGTGSNFLTGGPDTDVFFLDGRNSHPTWSTIADWQTGEQLCLWGWRPGISKAHWAEVGGLAKYSGVTLHADLDGNNTIDASVTWSGLGRSKISVPVEFDGLLWFK